MHLTAHAAPRIAAGTWLLDPARTAVAFSGRASRLAPTFRAAFTSVSGAVDVGSTTTLAVDVDVRSISTGNKTWDDLLHKLDPFDAERCPRALFRGSVDVEMAGRVGVFGALELRGVLRSVHLVAELRRQGEDEVVMSAKGEIDRRQFGVRCDVPGMGRLVPSVMRLDITATAVRAA